jgi:hypothetical protein
MRFGILADIHDSVLHLKRALAQFDRRRVDLVLTLGDAFESCLPGSTSAEVASLLVQARAQGVWGNHDAGLSLQITEKMRRKADRVLLEFTASLLPQLAIGQCRFSHNEPWLDASTIEGLWYWGRIPATRDDAMQSFVSTTEDYLFMGHHHRWILINTEGPIPWEGDSPIHLPGGDRYLIAVAGVCAGWSAVFDTESRMLLPISCAA